MSDVTPNYKVEQQRLRAAIMAQRKTIEDQVLAILEMADRKQRHLENIGAAKRAIAEHEQRLKDLEQAHGALTQGEIDAMTASV